MSEFEIGMGEELLEVLVSKLGSENKVKQWVKEFAEWVDVCIDDGDEDYVPMSESSSESEGESESECECCNKVVEEEYETELSEDNFHSLKECKVKEQK